MRKNTRNAFLKRVRLVILARKGIISILARVRELPIALAETDNICASVFFVLNVEKHQKCFLKTRAVYNSCSKGNIDRAARNRHDKCVY